MTQFWIEPLTDTAGNKYWLLFNHGQFHHPVAVIEDVNMNQIANQVSRLSMEINIHNIGKHIRSYRAERGLTQQEYADMAGVSRNYVSQLERGVSDNVTANVYKKLLSAMSYGVTK